MALAAAFLAGAFLAAVLLAGAFLAGAFFAGAVLVEALAASVVFAGSVFAGAVAVSPRLRFAASTEARKRRHQIDDISGCGLGLGVSTTSRPSILASMTCCSASR